MNRGPLLMLLATFVLTCMSATVKVARSELGALRFGELRRRVRRAPYPPCRL